jgi:hypothetical protein
MQAGDRLTYSTIILAWCCADARVHGAELPLLVRQEIAVRRTDRQLVFTKYSNLAMTLHLKSWRFDLTGELPFENA